MSVRKKSPSYFDSIGVASAKTGIPRDLLMAGKKAGCPCFRSGRVYRAGLREWFADHAEELKSNAINPSRREKKMDEEIRKLKLANDRVEKSMISRAAVVERWQRCATTMKNILRQKLENEYPAAVAGLDVPQARVYGKRMVDMILGEIAALEGEWKI